MERFADVSTDVWMAFHKDSTKKLLVESLSEPFAGDDALSGCQRDSRLPSLIRLRAVIFQVCFLDEVQGYAFFKRLHTKIRIQAV